MVLLTITETALEAIKVYHELNSEVTWKDGEPDLTQAGVAGAISHGQLIEISNCLTEKYAGLEKDRVPCELESLLKGARIFVPPPKPRPEKSPEYLALMARLREDEERRAYERMINPPPPVETSGQRFPGTKAYGSDILKDPIAQEVDDVTFADVNRQITLIINVLITIIACSVGIWITAWHWSTPARLGLSLGGSSVVAIAEVAIYFGYIKRVSDAKTKETRRSESKEVIETWVIDGKSGKRSIANGRDEALRQRKGKHR
ncbi:Hypothetical protein D9617_4g004170 [Elsinoe fawcettii]|nr:Hypothetical protein D9617_4g004170 [Elsinoe fawcettii]